MEEGEGSGMGGVMLLMWNRKKRRDEKRAEERRGDCKKL
jgi:hypothetical protein